MCRGPGGLHPGVRADVRRGVHEPFTTCALSAPCHGSGSTHLDLGPDADSAWEALTKDDYVIPGEPGCGELWIRLGDGTMPPGAPLSEAELCAVRLWIADGALR